MMEDVFRHFFKMACTLLSLLMLSVGDIAAQPSQPQPCKYGTKLCIGVRSNARPFSYKAELTREMSSDATLGPLRSAGYTGYMVHICDAVLTEMMMPSSSGEPIITSDDVGYYDIDFAGKISRQEDARMHEVPNPSRFGDLGRKYDILCDPATITNDRRNEFIVSPPLFLTGMSYITPKGVEVPAEVCDSLDTALIGVVGDTTANKEGLWALFGAGELPKYRKALLAYLKGESWEDGKSRSPCKGDQVGRIREFLTHREAASAFCRGEVFHYVGDLEIITENVKMIPGCDYDNGTRTYTNDRYAIFGRPAIWSGQIDARERQFLVAQFFQILGQKTVFNPSVLDKAYNETFQDITPSRKLDVFFWSVRGGKLKVR